MRRCLPIAGCLSLRLLAQTVDFPCVPDYRAVPSYIKVSEASGGQIFLFHKGELGGKLTGQVLSQLSDPTILRASGTLSAGAREFSIPVDPSVTSLAATAFAECVKVASLFSPSGKEVAGEKFKSGRIALVEQPEPGLWKIRLAGTGYFTVAAHAATSLRFTPRFSPPNQVEGYLPDTLSRAELKILSRDGGELASIPLAVDTTTYDVKIQRPTSPFRIAIEAADSQGFRIRRVNPPLLEP